MNKNLLTIILAASALSLSAATLSPGEALDRLGIGATRAFSSAELELTFTADTQSGAPAVYVFNRPEKSGYLIVSADDVAYPLLGYSDSGEFSEELMSPQMKWWLDEYARLISYATDHNAAKTAASSPIKVNREPIAPMLTTKWDQLAPYNNQCPYYGTTRTYTGCVATAVAQVMYYWQYPEIGRGNISYDSASLGKRLSLNFANRKIDWDNMLECYIAGNYNETQSEAVAYLMKAAGYAVKTDYAPDSSGAYAMNIANGLEKYFDYDPNMSYSLRMYYSASEWENMIYENLKNVGPVIYGGGSMLGGGHSFVCDGYDGNGYFHFNWGWSGMSDGYFLLDSLNPDSLGSGGGAGGGYNFTQDAVFGVQPPTGLPKETPTLQVTQMGSLAGVISENQLLFDLFAEEGAMWVNYNPENMKLRFGAIIEPQGDTPGETKGMTVSPQNFNIAPGYGTDPAHLHPAISLEEAALEDGTYKITFATLPLGVEDPEYVPVRPCYGYFNYIILKKSGEEYTLEINDVDRLAVVDAEIIGDLYYGALSKVKVTVANDNDIELTKGFAPALVLDNTVCFLGQSVFITVPPHSEVTREWLTPFELLQQMIITEPTEFNLTFFDESTYNFYYEDYYEPVVMKTLTQAPNVMIIGKPLIKDAQLVRETVGGKERDVYIVKDIMHLDVDVTLLLRGGYYSFLTYACVCQPDWENEDNGDVWIVTYGGYPLNLETNQMTPFSTTLSAPDIQPGEYYSIMMAFDIAGSLMGMSGPSVVFRSAESSGINEIENGDDSAYPIYNLQGICLGTDWEALPHGLYIRNGKKILK